MVLKRWLLFIVVFAFSLTVILSLLIYFQAKIPFKEANENAETYVTKNHLLAQVDASYVYNSTNTFHTVIGKTAKGEEKAFFLPEKKTDDAIMEVKLRDGISKEKAIELAMSNEKNGELLHAKLGVEEVGPVWEITYVNEKNNLNYVYLLFDNGDWWKKISNL
ncbi:cell wall elongation regulator TseB-like domain-containing protein [Psychrobacillus lasiicapitis]|uniref:Cell wall elongation regulator TseB-like domain-containing protein n=1 Tax=Psychrobacillus lasiicapitis TaxID=1636719 RepID=A0A544THP8_9BACI|nr:DUF5590 domain-containing protein [Psychrobacillus lasiicapitis]TQR16941.1 hypothetical protein FG382_01955 [Psychrobacillus lasiicapitis]GGA25898.1 peptidase M4 [Psychrobacillus lasiicapitis]